MAGVYGWVLTEILDCELIGIVFLKLSKTSWFAKSGFTVVEFPKKKIRRSS